VVAYKAALPRVVARSGAAATWQSPTLPCLPSAIAHILICFSPRVIIDHGFKKGWMMNKLISYSFTVGNVHVRLKRFIQLDTLEKVKNICQDNIEGIIRLWGLDPSRKNNIDIFLVRTLRDYGISFLYTDLGKGVVLLLILAVLFTIYKSYTSLALINGLIAFILALGLICVMLILLALVFLFVRLVLKRLFLNFQEKVAGHTTPGITKICINISNKETKTESDLTETVIHELCHALCGDLHLSIFPFSEGLALVTSQIQTRTLPKIIQEDKDEYFCKHEEYVQSKKNECTYVYSYWMIRYLIRDEVQRDDFITLIRDRKRLRSYKGEELKNLNEKAFQYFRDREDRYEIKF
jgi:hypothetical protein